MGTSRSSTGAPSRVPMVPPWTPSPTPPAPPPPVATPTENATPATPPTAPPPPAEIAALGRFANCRTAISSFAGTGSTTGMHRGLSRYVGSGNRGLGGAGTAVRRFGHTVRTAGVLYGVLSGADAAGAPVPGGVVDFTQFNGRPAEEILDVIVETVCPTVGTLDAEASRNSVRVALADLLIQYPNADLTAVSEEQKEYVIERFVANDIFARFCLDVGKSIQAKAPTAVVALMRLREVKDFIRESVAAAFRHIRAAGHRMSRSTILTTVREAMQQTFHIFEEYVL